MSYNDGAVIGRLSEVQRSNRKLEGQGSEPLSLGRESEVGTLKPELLSEATAPNHLCLSWSEEEAELARPGYHGWAEEESDRIGIPSGKQHTASCQDVTWWTLPPNGNGGWF